MDEMSPRQRAKEHVVAALTAVSRPEDADDNSFQLAEKGLDALDLGSLDPLECAKAFAIALRLLMLKVEQHEPGWWSRFCLETAAEHLT